MGLVVAGLVAGGVGFFWYYGSPRYTDVGYRPEQPIPFSHKLHAGDLGLDCRYCHFQVERSAVANIPPLSVCINCHQSIKKDSPNLAPLWEAWKEGRSVGWVKVHRLPDFVYFDHALHLRAGVSCFTCHGEIVRMEKVTQSQPLSMSWCLDCHRNPEPYLRPPQEMTNFTWSPSSEWFTQRAQHIKNLNLKPPVDCSACHR